MNGYGGDIQLASFRAFVQRLDVFEPMLKPIAMQIDFVFRNRVKHERIIWIRRMAQRKKAVGYRHTYMLTMPDGVRNQAAFAKFRLSQSVADKSKRGSGVRSIKLVKRACRLPWPICSDSLQRHGKDGEDRFG